MNLLPLRCIIGPVVLISLLIGDTRFCVGAEAQKSSAEASQTAEHAQPAPPSTAPAPATNQVAKPRARTPSLEPKVDQGLSIGDSGNENVLVKPTTEYVRRQDIEAVAKLESIRQMQGGSNQWVEVANTLKEVLGMDTSQETKRSVKQYALLILAGMAEERGQLPDALQYLAEYIYRYPNDAIVPEIFLRQAYLFRRLGAYDTALSKLYLVLRSALASQAQNVSLPYYTRVVLTAKTEIAETLFMWGKYAEAAERFALLLTDSNEELNEEVVRTKLIRALAKAGKHEALIREAAEFLSKNPGSEYQAEVRYFLASAHRALGHKQETLQQLLLLLEAVEVADPKIAAKWKSWKMLAGNEIGNQLFLEGDYLNAITVYKGLLALDDALSWTLPLHYQIGLCFEKYLQPEEALKSYEEIVNLSQKSKDKLEASLQMVVDMARFRINVLSWKRTTSGLLVLPSDQKVADIAKP